MSARKRRSGTEGFTLLEVLVATALMAIVVGALGTITSQWLPNWNRGVVRLQQIDAVALGLERVTADIAAAEFVTAASEGRAPLFEGTPHSVMLVRTGLGPQTTTGLEIVRITDFERQNNAATVRTRAPLLRQSDHHFRPLEPVFGDPVVLLRYPYVLVFSYAGPDRVWRNTWQRQTELPKAVKLMVRDTTMRQTSPFSTTVLLHAQVASECIASKSYADCLTLRSQPDKSAPGQRVP